MFNRLARWSRSPVGVVTASVLVTVVFACLANATLNLWHQAGSAPLRVNGTFVEGVSLFLLGALVVWLFVILVVAVLGRLWISVGVVTTATVLLGFASYRKQQLLLEPLYPSDLVFISNPGFLTQMVGLGAVVTFVAVSAAIVAVAALVGWRMGRWFPRPDRRVRPRAVWGLRGARVVAAVGSLAAISYLLQFHDSGNLFRATYTESGAHWRPWHQTANYADNGFVGGMLYNLPVPAMRPPPGYGPEAMQQLVTKYAGVADRINQTRDPAALEDVNVVLVLGEAFSDPTRVESVRLAKDPIPFTRSLMKRTTSGNMWSPKYGGGTANVEFEALTGLSISQFRPQLTTPYQMLVPNYASFPSSVEFLERQGHETLALHSYTSALYRRAEVYPVLGFDDAVFQDEMTHTGTLENNTFISDKATYREVLARLEDSAEPMFLNVVTMQNHYPMAGKYENPIPSTGLSDSWAEENLEHYARGLRYSDNAMRRFISQLEASDEKTAVVFYGDHLPAVWPPSALTKRDKHQTPFFVYTNFRTPQAERLPTTSPIYFMNHVLEMTDAYTSPYYALLQRLEQEIPVMDQGMMLGPDKRKLSRDQLSGRARRLLRDYRLVQYDLSIGGGYGADALFDTGQATHVAVPAHHAATPRASTGR